MAGDVVNARPWAAAALLGAIALPAGAHLVDTGLGPVYDGIAHFALTPEAVLPAIALAALAGLRGAAAARRVIAVLPLAWLLAALLALALPWPWGGAAPWLPLLLLGALIAIDLPLPPHALTMIAALMGLWLGAANGSAMAQAGCARAVFGGASALFVAITLVAAAAVAWQRGWLRLAWRVAGSWLAASGLLLLGWSLR